MSPSSDHSAAFVTRSHPCRLASESTDFQRRTLSVCTNRAREFTCIMRESCRGSRGRCRVCTQNSFEIITAVALRSVARNVCRQLSTDQRHSTSEFASQRCLGHKIPVRSQAVVPLSEPLMDRFYVSCTRSVSGFIALVCTVCFYYPQN